MAKISRADWAATTPWNGITDKPDSFGVTDISELTGDGYANGQIPVYNRTTGRFAPGSRSPAPSPIPPTPTPGTPTEISVTLDFPNLHALQSAYEDVFFIGVFLSQPIAVGASFANEFVQITASVIADSVVRITVTNMGLADLDLGEGIFRLRVFQ